MDVRLFIPCFVDQLYPLTGMNMVRLLEKAGCIVSYNPNQTCCGQPAYNAGYTREAAEVAKKFLHDFEGSGYVVSPSGSCAGFIRSYYDGIFNNSSDHLLCGQVQRNTFELSEFLVNVMKMDNFGASLNGRAVYHDACGALRDCNIKAEPRLLLSHVDGLELVEVQDAETCCGFGGTFSVKFQAISVGMAQAKVKTALDAKADYIISTDMSCLMHLQGYIDKNNLPVKAMHIADVLTSGW